MRTKQSFIYIFLFLVNLVYGQDAQKPKQIVNREIGFRMDLPKGFSKLSEQEKAKALDMGKKQIDKIYDTDFNIDGIEPNLFKKDDNNFFLINIKDYPSAEKEYQDEVKKSNEMLFNTYKKSFPNAEITQFNESKKIGNVSFNIYSLKTVISKSVVMKVVGYTSLYKGKDITLSAIYLDDAIGEEILKSINSAKFE